MAILVSYSDILVIQRKKNSGCIPAGIEWLLRYLKIPNVNYEAFQERHDLGEYNSFSSVSKHVMSEVRNVKLRDKPFSSGREKIEYIRQLINESRPCLISLALERGNCHIVPVIEISDSDITVLWMDKATIEGQKRKFLLNDIEKRHNTLQGGKDILFVET